MNGGFNRAEAERWLYTANKLLTARDLHGARSFAIRARESDPTFDASELLLTVIDTLLAGEVRINDNHRDYYGILQVLRYTTNIDHIAAQYRRLALLLDPHRNPFAFSGNAFSLVNDAWSMLSNPVKKVMYDSELRLVTTPQPSGNPRSMNGATELTRQNGTANESAESTRQTPTASVEGDATFWTSCPYCYVMYEYPKVYEEYTLRCQCCRRAFHAVVIRSPPLNGKDASFCSWGFFPLGFSPNSKDVNGFSSNWNPFSPLFPCPLKGSSSSRKPRRNWNYYDDEAAEKFIEISDPSEDDSDDGDWGVGEKRGRKRSKTVMRKGSGNGSDDVRINRGSHGGGDAGHENVGTGGAVDGSGSAVPSSARAESSKKAAMPSSRKRGAGNMGRLDLNMEFSNDVEEPSRGVRDREGNANGNAEDNIEGIGFFEGLDVFLNSLPILNVVADDKVKGH